jgi:hypothetical protein
LSKIGCQNIISLMIYPKQNSKVNMFLLFVKLNLRTKALLGSAINQVTKRGHVEMTNNIFRLKTNFDIRKR